eukprot:CAMPEP_0194754226 /NCGR_PEP_ID=MMETSP0323_2-20130528/8191_1 /TAXON_ID=2866 ORGANISM="Crypthecodinium cohnii, Strain Seligo" /NCGR_SAMPLE_ID=MMETSP0323_2 /ASSEMBLY_ACC=CAM_ASM_000346 /LENGTH=58 /DNA_ID=CAMNT_0039672609 /DNA_START=1 /DNA_END=174 /DNA_ORIENTATION=+
MSEEASNDESRVDEAPSELGPYLSLMGLEIGSWRRGAVEAERMSRGPRHVRIDGPLRN